MSRVRRAALPLAALLLAGALTPAVSTTAEAATTVTISGTAFDAATGTRFDRVRVVYPDPAALRAVENLPKGPRLDDGDIAEDGRFHLAVPAGKPFFLTVGPYNADYAETFVGAGGSTSAAYPTLRPITATGDLDLGAVVPIRTGAVRIVTNLASESIALLRLDRSTAYSAYPGKKVTSVRLTGITPGRYLAAVGTDAEPIDDVKEMTPVTVKPGTETTVTVTRRFTDVKGRVLTTKGKALKNVIVVARSAKGARTSDRTDSAGRYSLDDLATGTYRVTYVGATGGSSSTYLDGKAKKVTLTGQATRTLKNVRLAKGGVVAGTVRTGSSTARIDLVNSSGIAVSTYDGEVSTKKGITTFRTRGVRTGTYTLIVQLPNGRYAKQKVKVRAGKVSRVGRVVPSRKPVTVKGRITGATDGFVSFFSRQAASGRRAFLGSGSIRSTGRFTARVVPGRWSVHAVGSTPGNNWIGTAETDPRLTITTSKTISIPVHRLTRQVTSFVTLNGTPVTGLYFRTENPKSRGDEYFRGNFYSRGEKAPAGTYRGSWGWKTPANSRLHVFDDGQILPVEGPFYFAATSRVSKPSDLRPLTLTVKGGA